MIKNINKEEYLKKLIRSIITFISINIGNAALDFILFFVFGNVLSVSLIWSQVISYSLASLNRFFFNKIINYRNREFKKSLVQQIFRFIPVNLFVLGLSSFLMSILYGGLGLSSLLSKIIVTTVTMLINSTSYKYLIFREKDNKNKQT